MGPLTGIRVIELAGIGPGPFCGMLLGDLGAEVLRIDRSSAVGSGRGGDVLARGRRSIGVDLKNPDGVETVLKLVESADILYEGYRPGVAERLGVGPDACLERNPRLVYGRMTGWGQEGPMAQAAGHDINYIALAGALEPIGRAGDRPVPPLNLVGDFGGGGLLLAFGLMAALVERQTSGKGQVVDAAMVDGASTLMTFFHGMRASGGFDPVRGTNMLDTGAPFYEVYETSDGKYVALGSIEPQFYAELIERTALKDADLPKQMDRAQWPAMKETFAKLFITKTRDEWCEVLEGTDVCFAPVLALDEVADHPHNKARNSYVKIDGVVQPAPAPRFSRSQTETPKAGPKPGADTDTALLDWGFSAADLERLRASGAVA